MTTPKLTLPELAVGQAGKELTHNDALAILDQLVQARVLDKDLSAPPGSPVDGAAYIVGPSPTGTWAGSANKLAYWRSASGAWRFLTPVAGWQVWVTDENKQYRYSGSAWAEVVDPTLTALAGLATGADQLPYSTGTDVFAQTPLTSFARTLLDDADAATVRGTIGINDLPTKFNYILNGNFDFWQRGTSLPNAVHDAYLADRWLNQSNGSTIAVSRQSFTIGQTDVPGEPEFFSRSTVSSVAGGGSFATLVQKILDVRRLAGRTVTLSFYAKADAAKPISIELIQLFGSGGSPLVTSIGATKFTLSTAWAKYTATIQIPSVSGKTIGSTPTPSTTQLSIWFDAGATYNARTQSLGQQSGVFDIAQVQIEEGAVPTKFITRSKQAELAECQAYYYQTYSEGSPPGSAVIAGSVSTTAQAATNYLAFPTVFFPTTMIRTPSITAYALDGTPGSCTVDGVLKAVTVAASGDKCATIRINNVAVAPNQFANVHATADAELF